MVTTGIDIVKVERIRKSFQKAGNAFLNKIFTKKEIAYCQKKTSRYLSLAARFAAKEAFIKAVGDRKIPVRYKDIEIIKETSKPPAIRLSQTMKKKLKLTRKKIAVSLAHEKDYAVAVVIIS